MLVELKIVDGAHKGKSWFVNPRFVVDVHPRSNLSSWVNVIAESETNAPAVLGHDCEGLPAEIAAKLNIAEAKDAD